jgi:hypothetical protein
MITEVFRKPYDVQSLEAADGAEGINQNFDAIWWALQKLKDETTILSAVPVTASSGGVDEAFVMMTSGI